MSGAMWTLVTGGSGFIGHEFVKELVRRGERVLLLQRRLVSTGMVEERDGIRAITGDIRVPSLGVSASVWSEIGPHIRQVFHLAALFDVEADRQRLWEANVEGTRQVLDVAERFPKLERICHVSTAYVCGRTEGVFREQDLDRGQAFRNLYEETKYQGECLVRARAKSLPVIVVRPSMVVDDVGIASPPRVGAYRLIDAVLRLSVLPFAGMGNAPLNVVPLTFVARALAALAAAPDSIGRTYHLCDPHPLSAREFCRAVARAAARRCLVLPVGGRIVARVIKMLRERLRLADALDCLNTWPIFDTAETEMALATHGLYCPMVSTYLDTVVRYYKESLDARNS